MRNETDEIVGITVSTTIALFAQIGSARAARVKVDVLPAASLIVPPFGQEQKLKYSPNHWKHG